MHSPFLYNLFVCCGENYKTFVVDISNHAEDKIEKIYKEVENNIKSRKNNDKNRSIISKEFRKFVEDMERCRNSRNPQYCIFGFYKQIAKIEQYLSLPKNEDETIVSTDMDIVKKYRELYDYFIEIGAEAINERRLKVLFAKIRDRNKLNKNQEDLYEFLLSECFPNYSDERGGLLERISSKSWKEVAFGNIKQQKMANNILQKDGRNEQLNDLFNKFKNIQVSDTFNIKKNLIKISRFLDEIYQCEDYYNDEKRVDEIQDDHIAEDTISELHSHILAFMHWIPVIGQNESNEKIMESIDNIIEEIKLQVYEIINNQECLKQMLAIYPTNYCESIFIQTNDVDLRKLLIKAMYHEPYVCKLFQHFY